MQEGMCEGRRKAVGSSSSTTNRHQKAIILLLSLLYTHTHTQARIQTHIHRQEAMPLLFLSSLPSAGRDGTRDTDTHTTPQRTN
jgi:hypothetical protein